ncbi:unnamed protein product [Amoebophrya sp. A25]|nr:unnamed protein product [Amoebophrya sp. A25]|eukprot:GSA25T00012617001.1
MVANRIGIKGNPNRSLIFRGFTVLNLPSVLRPPLDLSSIYHVSSALCIHWRILAFNGTLNPLARSSIHCYSGVAFWSGILI